MNKPLFTRIKIFRALCPRNPFGLGLNLDRTGSLTTVNEDL